MLIFTIHFIQEREPDEILKVYKLANDMFKCDFYPSDVNYRYTFKLNRSFLLDYIGGTLEMVAHDDMDPYEQVQITTFIHPRILFHVADLSKPGTYQRMLRMLTMTMNTPILKNGLSTTRPSTTNAHSERVQNFQRYFERNIEEDSDS